jgi:hypothetical protein
VVVLHLGRVAYDGPVTDLDAPRLVHLMAGYAEQRPVAVS